MDAYILKIKDLGAKISLHISEKAEAQSHYNSSKIEYENLIKELKVKLGDYDAENSANRETITRITSERGLIETKLQQAIAEANNLKIVILHLNQLALNFLVNLIIV